MHAVQHVQPGKDLDQRVPSLSQVTARQWRHRCVTDVHQRAHAWWGCVASAGMVCYSLVGKSGEQEGSTDTKTKREQYLKRMWSMPESGIVVNVKVKYTPMLMQYPEALLT